MVPVRAITRYSCTMEGRGIMTPTLAIQVIPAYSGADRKWELRGDTATATTWLAGYDQARQREIMHRARLEWHNGNGILIISPGTRPIMLGYQGRGIYLATRIYRKGDHVTHMLLPATVIHGNEPDPEWGIGVRPTVTIAYKVRPPRGHSVVKEVPVSEICES